MVKVVWFRFQQCLGPFTMLLFEGSSQTGIFRHLASHSFRSLELPKYINYEGRLFFGNAQNFISILKMHKKIETKLFILEIIASDLVALNCLY